MIWREQYDVQNWIKMFIEIKQVLVKLNPATRRFYRKLTENPQDVTLGTGRRNTFPLPWSQLLQDFMNVVSSTYLSTHCHHRLVQQIQYAPIPKPIQMKWKTKYFSCIVYCEEDAVSMCTLIHDKEGRWGRQLK